MYTRKIVGSVRCVYGHDVVMNAVNKYRLALKDSKGKCFDYVGFPFKVEGPAIGHMINDGASNRDGKDYMRLTQMRENVTFKVLTKDWAVGIATRDIKKDEELFFSYGESYWRDEVL